MTARVKYIWQAEIRPASGHPLDEDFVPAVIEPRVVSRKRALELSIGPLDPPSRYGIVYIRGPVRSDGAA